MIVCDQIMMGICPDETCRCVHLTLCDEGKEIASVALPIEYVKDFAQRLHDNAYRVATLKEES